MKKYMIINEKDNVAVALTDILKNEVLQIGTHELTLHEDIKQGHKFAITDINCNTKVIKYGSPIGIATSNIHAGEHVHIDNLKTSLSDKTSYCYNPNKVNSNAKEIVDLRNTFYGYLRKDNKVGIRNEIWIIPTVGCVNNTAQKIAQISKEKFSNLLNIDDFIAFSHPYGCSQLGDDQENTRKILADLCLHPNAAGVLLLGLGCENSGIETIKKYIQEFDSDRIKCLISQESEDEISDSLVLIEELVHHASKEIRTELPVSSLIIGVKCGGSDGLSGITANPLVGNFSDLLISKGGSIIMTEVPEMFGAETLLMNRCKDKFTFDKTVNMINDFKKYFTSHNQPVYENPSPGNKAGGISTLEDKSLGCTQKSGTSPINDVLYYGERVKCNGLSLLASPGNDLVASTALAASGAQIILFTTGRGTPFASPVPTMKISSNSDLYRKKNNWIDFDAGQAINNSNLSSLSVSLYDQVLQIASGKLVKSELAGYHDMAIFKQNITL